MHEPHKTTKRKKCLESLEPSYEYEPPIWQLRVGDFRIFYDIDEEHSTVNVRAVRRKDGKTTDDVT